MKKFITLLFLGALMSIISIGCDSTEETTQTEESKVIKNIGNNIILDIYENLEPVSDLPLVKVKALHA